MKNDCNDLFSFSVSFSDVYKTVGIEEYTEMILIAHVAQLSREIDRDLPLHFGKRWSLSRFESIQDFNLIRKGMCLMSFLVEGDLIYEYRVERGQEFEVGFALVRKDTIISSIVLHGYRDPLE